MASDAFKQKLLAQARAFHADALKQTKKKKLQDYIRASSGDATHRQTVANYTKTPDSKIASRNAGQERAQQRLNKLGEDVSTDVCPVCGQTPCNCTHIEEAKATMCGRCGTKHVPPSKGGTCPALKEEQESVEEAKSSVLGVSGKRTTVVQRAIRRAQKTPQEVAMVGENTNPYVVEGLVDESSDKLYAGFQADVLSLKAKAKKQEQERGPVDIQKLAARLKAVKLPPEGKKK